jgi:Ca2+-binding RTX toxin-like protein
MVASLLVVIASPATAAPTNDNFANARVITGNSASFTSNNIGATLESGETTFFPNQKGSTVWFRWTAPSDGYLYVSVGDFQYYPVLGVFTGSSVGSLTEVAINSSDYTYTSVSANVTAGTTYSIVVDSRGYADGFHFHLSSYPSLPTNDNLGSARILSNDQGEVSGATFGATTESLEPDHGGTGGPFRSVWFNWTAPSTGSVAFDTAGSQFDTVLAVYTGTNFGKLTTIVRNDDCDGNTPSSCVTFNATSGTRYRIALDGYRWGEEGPYILNWAMRSTCTVVGTSGDDTLDATAANDVICGLGGNDLVRYANAPNAVRIDLATQSATGWGTDTLVDIEGAIGSPFNDQIDGDGGPNRLFGAAGNDAVAGHDGDDTVDGGPGTDLLFGGSGTNTIIGGFGPDTVGYLAATGPVTVDLAAGTGGATGWSTDTIQTVENINGSAHADNLSGTTGANSIRSGAGADSVAGREGNDNLNGGSANDLLYPGGGTDTVAGDVGSDTVSYRFAPNAVTVNLGANQATGWGTTTLTSIENVIGSNFADTLTGSGARNLVRAMGGPDTINTQDSLSGDTADGGNGADSCTTDAGDTRISCP